MNSHYLLVAQQPPADNKDPAYKVAYAVGQFGCFATLAAVIYLMVRSPKKKSRKQIRDEEDEDDRPYRRRSRD